MTSTQRLAYAKARALGRDVVIVDFPSYVHVIPAEEMKEGAVAFTATPLAALEHACPSSLQVNAAAGARAMAREYGVPQAVWRRGSGSFTHCAASIDYNLYDEAAVRVEVIDAN